MAFSKASLYRIEDQIISGFASALKHPARLQIILKLALDGTCTVIDLKKSHPISQSAMSQHLKSLRESKLVIFVEKFPYTYYSLDEKVLAIAEKQLISFFVEIKSNQSLSKLKRGIRKRSKK